MEICDSQVCGIVHLPSSSVDWPCSPEVIGDLSGLQAGVGDAAGVVGTSGHAVPRSSLRVLLVEDNPADAFLVSRALGHSISPHFSVVHVDTMAAGIAVIKAEDPFDVVLLDLSLPDSWGIQTLVNMQAAAPRVPIVIMTGNDDPEIAEHMLEAGAQDYLVKSPEAGGMVTRAIRYAITRMAAQIERQALTDRLLEHQKNLMRELESARSMQFDLLPAPVRFDPILERLGLAVESGFEPSSSIGGDLWGCLECSDERIAFYTFDFSGHGVGAALNVFRLHALIANSWDESKSPGEILGILNGQLNSLLRRGQFATMFLGVVDCRRDTLTWSSAGAPRPVLAQDGQVEYLDSRGIPLGLTARATYPTRTVALPVGASLFLYSDALTEAENSGDPPGMLGEEGLQDLIVRQVGDGAAMRVDRLLGDFRKRVRLPLQDDLTAVCITRLRPIDDGGEV